MTETALVSSPAVNFTPCGHCRSVVESLQEQVRRLTRELQMSQAAVQQTQKERDRVVAENHRLYERIRQHVPGLIKFLSRMGEVDHPGQQVLLDILAQAGVKAPSSSQAEPSSPPLEGQDQQQQAAVDEPQKKVDGRSRSKHPRGGSMPWPLGAEERETLLPAPELAVTDDQGRPLVQVGVQEVRKEVHVEPGKLWVEIFKAPVFAPQDEPSDIIHVEAPERILPDVAIGHDTIAALSIWRYAMLLPMYRIQEMLAQFAWPIPRGTLCRWLINSAPDAVAAAIHQEILAASCVSFDDTSWWVLKPDLDQQGQPSFTPQGEAHQARIFALADANGSNIAYHYRPNKLGEHLLQLMAGYTGNILVDDCRGYIAPLKQLGIVPANCWAHVRTKIDEANDLTWGPYFLELIKKLFETDDGGVDRPPDERRRHRQRECTPIVDEFFNECERIQPMLAPKDPLANAVTYALRLRTGLERFLDDPSIPLSNNGIERGFRPVAISRRNSLFSDTERGARASSIWMTVIQSARRLGLNLIQYVPWMFDHLAAGSKDPSDLTPCAYQREQTTLN